MLENYTLDDSITGARKQTSARKQSASSQVLDLRHSEQGFEV
jgi:hypothetical protein